MTLRRGLLATVGVVRGVAHAAECSRLSAAAAASLLPSATSTLWTASEAAQQPSRLLTEVRALSHAEASTSARGFFTTQPPESKVYKQRRLVGWTPDQLYTVVSKVEDYHMFVPWCQRSRVTKPPAPQCGVPRPAGRAGPAAARGNDTGSNGNGNGGDANGNPVIYMEAELEVGFQVLVERYTSKVYLSPHRSVRSTVPDSSLFDHLDSTWTMEPGPTPRTCWLSFHVDFAFRSQLHGYLADLFFSEVVKQMCGAFEGRCEKLYGPSSLFTPPTPPSRGHSSGHGSGRGAQGQGQGGQGQGPRGNSHGVAHGAQHGPQHGAQHEGHNGASRPAGAAAKAVSRGGGAATAAAAGQ